MAGDAFTIRPSAATDRPALMTLYPLAFPDEELRPLVDALLDLGPPVLSLVAEAEGVVVGHVAFTRCGLEGAAAAVAMLAPLAVTPAWQRRGVGKALIEAGCRRLDAVDGVLVLGDPAYYGRCGFEAGHGIRPPYELPAEWADAWRYRRLRAGQAAPAGLLRPPAVWMQPALWGA